MWDVRLIFKIFSILENESLRYIVITLPLRYQLRVTIVNFLKSNDMIFCDIRSNQYILSSLIVGNLSTVYLSRIISVFWCFCNIWRSSVEKVTLNNQSFMNIFYKNILYRHLQGVWYLYLSSFYTIHTYIYKFLVMLGDAHTY